MKEINRQSNDEVLDVLITHLEGKNLPASMEANKQSLLKKLKAERARSKSQYIDDGEIYKTPSMGIVELSHESLPEPAYLFGTDIKNKDIVRLKVFSARKNVVTTEILKEELLAEVIMSETQFGNIIMNNGCSMGHPVTMVYDFSEDVPEYDPELDISKKNMAEVVNNVVNSCQQVDGFIKDISIAIGDALSVGKMNKKDADRLCHIIGSVTNQTIDNNVFYVDRFTEEMSKRSDEAALNMNISAKNLQLLSYKR